MLGRRARRYGVFLGVAGVVVAAMALIVTRNDAADTAAAEGSHFTPREVERIVRGAYEADLKNKQKRGQLKGAIAVVDLRCRAVKPSAKRLVLCVAAVAAIGKARSIAPSQVTIRVTRPRPRVLDYRPVRQR